MTSSDQARSAPIRPVVCLLLSVDKRRGALDLHDLDSGARLEDVVLVVGAGRPVLAAELHPAAVAGRRARSPRRGRRPERPSRCGSGRRAQVPPRDRAGERQRRRSSATMKTSNWTRPSPRGRHERGGHGGERHRRRGRTERGHLPCREDRGGDQPERPSQAWCDPMGRRLAASEVRQRSSAVCQRPLDVRERGRPGPRSRRSAG